MGSGNLKPKCDVPVAGRVTLTRTLPYMSLEGMVGYEFWIIDYYILTVDGGYTLTVYVCGLDG